MARIALLALTVLVGCARPPRPLQGEFPPTSVGAAQATSHEGERVRWGGTITDVRLEKDRTCLEVVGRPLDRRARPRRTDVTEGRFHACVNGFLDPEVYVAKREVTVVGTLLRSTEGKVGEYEYVFPVVAVETIHLWPERPEPRDPVMVYGVRGGWGWGPWGWYGPGYYGRWGGGGWRSPPRPRR